METQKGDSDTKSKTDDYEVIEQLGRRAIGTAFLVLHRTEKKKFRISISANLLNLASALLIHSLELFMFWYVLKKIPFTKQTEKSKRSAHQEVFQLLFLILFSEIFLYYD
ncbi:serine/threonine-protein kinase Nek2-like [Lycium barbarum]|uniref:serine/threonine-protein kinase Nek2-like n=1 Tax=Lycium barbarum TaxID=112863 RepID=UPI00293E33D1|nr:serine/threonine-protein kinase Nek2-like [Lycium barbarum]XP_060177323.1 serine/threonine-protein kinase Nek2-like [Lycium barbarum]XP_060177324.1 serine/threonine-protein kinase Nek2-like [Lycium barbarum]XP_060177325.1 serine/threonine-protein kinase Nek2-like [Lycium barbarum]XP_060177326.1 serine/threonine-protein kinase Nek2-like [Lycium barbarum]